MTQWISRYGKAEKFSSVVQVKSLSKEAFKDLSSVISPGAKTETFILFKISSADLRCIHNA